MNIKYPHIFICLLWFVVLTACSSGGSEPQPDSDVDSSPGDSLPDDPGLPNLFPNPTDKGSPIALDNPVVGTVDKGGQRNYSFTANAGTTYTVTVTPSSGVAYLRVYINDDYIAGSLTQYQNSVSFTPENTTTYTFSIRGFTDAEFEIHVGEGLGNTSLWLTQETMTIYGTKNSVDVPAKETDVYHLAGELHFDAVPNWLTLDVQPGDQANYSKLVITPSDTEIGGSADLLVHLVRDGSIVAEKPLHVDYELRNPLTVYNDQFQEISETSYSSFTLSNQQIIDRFEINRVTNQEQYEAQNNSLDWTAVSDQSWLEIQTICSCGNVGQNDQIYFTINNYGQLAVGKHTAIITLTDVLTGYQTTFSVILNLDANAILASKNGIALMQSASEATLSQTISVSNTAKMTDLNVEANTSTSWLTATVDNIDNTITVTANPEGLAAEIVHFATVTMSSSQTANQEAIEVGFYITANTTDDSNIISFDSKNYFCRCQRMVADPVRPYVYIQHFGPKVLIYNIYTSELIGEYDIAAALGRDFETSDIEISSNGDRLFVRENLTANVVTVDINSEQINPPWNLNTLQDEHNVGQLKYTRVDGKAVLLTYLVSTNGTWRSSRIAAYDAIDGNLLGDHSDTVINHAYKILEAPPLSNYLTIGEYDSTIKTIVIYEMHYSEVEQSFEFERYNTRNTFVNAFDDFSVLGNTALLYTINDTLSKHERFSAVEDIHNLTDGSSSLNLNSDYHETLYALMTAEVDGAINYWLLKYNAVTGAITESTTVSNTYRAKETHSRLSADGQRVMSLGFTGGSPSSSDGQEVIWFMSSRF